MTQTWWLSFSDGDKPEGQQFLGVVVVDVDEADVGRAEGVANAIRHQHHLPPLTALDDRMMTAAVWKTHRSDCNPGGAVLAARLDGHVPANILAACPRNQVLSRAELQALGLRPTDAVE